MSSQISLTRLVRETTPDRHQKATAALADGSLTVHLTHQDDTVIRALVTHSGKQYGVSITEHGAFCGCPDFSWKGVTCKHQTATALFCLQQPPAVDSKIHLMRESGDLLCNHTLTPTSKFWRKWTDNAANWTDIVCQPCVFSWTHPQTAKEAA